ncbi:hypothetical protein [Streptomyces sp. NPDC054794]
MGNVLSWYNRQLLLARRTGDQPRLEELMMQRQQCVEDQVRLRDAGPEEVTRIADVYTERLKELQASEPQGRRRQPSDPIGRPDHSRDPTPTMHGSTSDRGADPRPTVHEVVGHGVV